jgi:hypothetical protein
MLKETRGSLPMENNSTIFRETLIGFMAEEDPLPGMMKWMMDQLMKIEAGKDQKDRQRAVYTIFRARSSFLSVRYGYDLTPN